ncbi:uncharacterized protein I303_103183 [Kwoniella dejecticola CBS 10117]|uniref:N-acetylglucosaminylphosphatidylinositol deacetylase n=1 Tax=Kwoniella dejecticola CBS 10117 TaxID=1296121 RepID=A0A1A6AAT5_9TREE|nr:uncharacterized protein I303_03206 [Kwoniella dejecticola CBS 10117]OBR87182.1 hypothetical protein I303_03206 [Kwoniella dejecticola CBS 10117]
MALAQRRTPPEPASLSPSRPFTPLLLLAVLAPLFALLSPYNPLSSLSQHSNPFESFPLAESNALSDTPKALIVTAHPDDEVMFFSPTIWSLNKAGWEVSGLCLSTGNSSGLGAMRTDELYKSYEVLGVERKRIGIIDHPDLQDSMTAEWDPALILSIVEKHLSTSPADVVITFDERGISNHPNHIAISEALSSSTRSTQNSLSSIKVLHLRSPAILPKFTGPLYPIYLQVHSTVLDILNSNRYAGTDDTNDSKRSAGHSGGRHDGSRSVIVISNPSEWLTGIRAMMAHESQLVWFRWLYISFSRLMWVNELLEI